MSAANVTPVPSTAALGPWKIWSQAPGVCRALIDGHARAKVGGHLPSVWKLLIAHFSGLLTAPVMSVCLLRSYGSVPVGYSRGVWVPHSRAVIFLSEASLPTAPPPSLATEEPGAWAGGQGCAQCLEGQRLRLTQPHWSFLPPLLGLQHPRACHLLLPPLLHPPPPPAQSSGGR